MSAILVIEDNETLRELFQLALARAGHEVWVADNGKDGIKLLQAHPIDVMITDVVMAGQDGLESVQIARKLRPKLPVIVISGDAPRHAPLYLKLAGHFGANKVLLKPFPIETLISTVQ
jgi:CheY-like chemotaxis protein